MKIFNTEIEYFIDYVSRTIHIKERPTSSFHSLFNEISPEFQSLLIEEEHLLMDVLDFEWICYGFAGLIMEYKNYSLVFVSKTDERLHKPFISV
jgi:hypothetical protein